MKKSIPIIRERESEAFILGNGREREFPLTPGSSVSYQQGDKAQQCFAIDSTMPDDLVALLQFSDRLYSPERNNF